MNVQELISVCLIDDHKLIRDGIRLILNGTKDIVLEDEGCSLEDLLVLMKTKQKLWDIILLDISLPDTNGLEALELIRIKYPNLPVLIVTMHDETQFGIRALQAGANGYLTKDNAAKELIVAIKKIKSGKKYISSSFSDYIAMGTFGNEQIPAHHQLSTREFDVFLLLATGVSPSEIGYKLGISIKTVSTYRSRILVKLDIETNADITRYCLKNELIL